MSTTAQLRAVVVGLIAFAAAEEEMLLASAASDIADPGNERRWAAVPTVAHNTEFKAQQAERITAVLAGCAPPAFGEIDHRSPAVYGRLRRPGRGCRGRRVSPGHRVSARRRGGARGRRPG